MPTTIQSALHPAGIQAASISHLWWLMFWTCAAVYVLAIGAVAVAVFRRRPPGREAPSERSLMRWVAGASAATIVVLFGLLFASVVTGRTVASLESPEALTLEITGNQWWWDVAYDNPHPSLRVRTANEMHLPVGRPVQIRLTSNDVIHSFWVPNLHGKMDLIPGRRTVLWLQTDRPGVYRGQCAEYCGLQHAHMAFTVVVEPADDFERWLEAQRRPAPPPATPEQEQGRLIVEHGPCAVCHTVRGTTAGGRTAPDLTHLTARRTIAASTAPNRPDVLARWIADPQHLKPGSRMPATGLSDAQLQAVVAYLDTLR
jgi:cytochrome c oxidase subunit 2